MLGMVSSRAICVFVWTFGRFLHSGGPRACMKGSLSPNYSEEVVLSSVWPYTLLYLLYVCTRVYKGREAIISGFRRASTNHLFTYVKNTFIQFYIYIRGKSMIINCTYRKCLSIRRIKREKVWSITNYSYSLN